MGVFSKMSILTEKEIAHIAGAESRNVMEFARAIESAVLAKLAGMDLPKPYQRETYATSANTESVRKGFEMGGYVKTPNLWDENQLHQAFAQGAASQLSAEPSAWFVIRSNPGRRDDGLRYGPFWKQEDANDWEDAKHAVKPLYTLKEPK